MQMTATNWLLYELTSSPLQLGLNGVFRAVPALTLGLISGTFADRYDRKRLLLLTQAILALVTFALGMLDYAGQIQAWQIYLFTFISASVGSFDGPARQALFPSLIPRAVLPNAVALNSVLWKGAALIGPTLGGIAISLMGTAGAFFANAASFLVVVVGLLLMRAPSSGRGTEPASPGRSCAHPRPRARSSEIFSPRPKRDFPTSSPNRLFSVSPSWKPLCPSLAWTTRY